MLASALLLASAQPGLAQGKANQTADSKSGNHKVIGTSGAAKQEPELSSAALQAEPTIFAPIGLSMRLPLRSTCSRMVAEEFPAWQVESSPAAWSMRVQMAFAPDPKTDCATQLRGAVSNLALGGAAVKTLSERDLKVSGRNARVVWASATRDGVTNVAGWMVIETGEGIFISLGVVTSQKDFADTESLLDASFASASVSDPREMQAARAAQVERGKAWLRSLTPDHLKSVAAGGGKPLLQRIWRPMPDGSEQEIGWVETTIRPGTRADAAVGGSAGSRDGANAEPGLLVKLEARTTSPDGVTRVEIRARYWVAFDLGAEAWSIRTTQKGIGPDSQFSQIGIRARRTNGEPGRDLIVSAQSEGAASEPQSWQVPPEAYLPQALVIALGETLPRPAESAGDCVMYALDAKALRLCQRPIAWASTPEGGLQFSVRVNPDAPAYVERWDARGKRLDHVEPDGSHTTPSTAEEIQRRWNALGLDP